MTGRLLSPAAPPDWLTARPVAHRGLHDLAQGLVENTVGAALAAIARGYAIECDVQPSRDGEAMVVHDRDLDRLTLGTGSVAAQTRTALEAVAYRHGGDRIVSLPTFLAAIGGRVPLVCEIKSRFDGDMRLADRTRAIAAAYPGPIALKSFDPAVIAHLRADAPCPLGVVAEATYDHPEWASLSDARKRELSEFLHVGETRPDFLSYHVGDLPHAVPHLCRLALGCPVLTWTVRTLADRATAAAWADQIVFEGFLP